MKGRRIDLVAAVNEGRHPACELCRGACCETLSVPLNVGTLSNDSRRYFRMRGRIEGSTLRLDAPCQALTGEGTCGVYSTRPQGCKDYVVGGDACVAAVRAQRCRPDADQILGLMG